MNSELSMDEILTMTKDDKKKEFYNDDDNPTFSDISEYISDEASDVKQRKKNVLGDTYRFPKTFRKKIFTNEPKNYDLGRISRGLRGACKGVGKNKKAITSVIALIAAFIGLCYLTHLVIRKIRLDALWEGSPTKREAVEELCKFHIPLPLSKGEKATPLMCAQDLVENVADKLSHASWFDTCDETLFDHLKFIESDTLAAEIPKICKDFSLEPQKIKSDIEHECGVDCNWSIGLRLHFAGKKLSQSFSVDNILLTWHSSEGNVMYGKGVALAHGLFEQKSYAMAIGAAVIAAEAIRSEKSGWVATELDNASTILEKINLDKNGTSQLFKGTPEELYWALRIEGYCNQWFGSGRQIGAGEYFEKLRAAMSAIRSA